MEEEGKKAKLRAGWLQASGSKSKSSGEQPAPVQVV